MDFMRKNKKRWLEKKKRNLSNIQMIILEDQKTQNFLGIQSSEILGN